MNNNTFSLYTFFIGLKDLSEMYILLGIYLTVMSKIDVFVHAAFGLAFAFHRMKSNETS